MSPAQQDAHPHRLVVLDVDGTLVDPGAVRWCAEVGRAAADRHLDAVDLTDFLLCLAR